MCDIKHKIVKIIAITMAIFGCLSLFSMEAFADQSSAGSGDQSDHNASGGGSTNSDHTVSWGNGGWFKGDEGISCAWHLSGG